MKEPSPALLERYRQRPDEFARDLFGDVIWKGEERLMRTVAENKYTAIRAGHGLSKSHAFSRLVLWFLCCFPPAKVITTAPCNDKETEILTKKGWYKFPDLPRGIEVATLEEGKLVYRKPEEYFEFNYTGELLGVKNYRINFLVTPNHRCLVKKRDGIQKHKYEIKSAQEIYGRERYFSKEIIWEGEDCGFTDKQLELFGFWFGDGYVRRGGKYRRGEIVITQSKYPEYVRQLLVDNNEKATFYINNFIRDGKKQIPQWLKDATPHQIKLFLKGLMEADGSPSRGDKNKVDRIRIYGNRKQADEIYELIIKSGKMANMAIREPSNKICYIEDRFTYLWRAIKRSQLEYDIRILRQGGHTGRSRKNHWYRKQYSGKVYSVKVPSGIILVRRNGFYHWTGNTDRQVRGVLWSAINEAYGRVRPYIGGRITQTELTIKPEWYALGFKSKDYDPDAFQGFHQKNVLVIFDEASGIKKPIWDSAKGLMTGEVVKMIAGGQPMDATGDFAECFKSLMWKPLHLSCFDSPNVTGECHIPGLVDMEWINDRKKDYGEDSPLWQVRVEGEFPREGEHTLIPLYTIQSAMERELEAKGALFMGVDVARYGDDSSVIKIVSSNSVEVESEEVNKFDTMEVTGKVVSVYNSYKEKGRPIDCIGVDVIGMPGVHDRLRELKLPVMAVNVSETPKNPLIAKKYVLIRDEIYGEMAEEFKRGEIKILDVGPILLDLSGIQYHHASEGRVKIEGKKEIKKRNNGRSPDYGDALAIALHVKRMCTGKIDLPEMEEDSWSGYVADEIRRREHRLEGRDEQEEGGWPEDDWSGYGEE